MGWQEDIQSTRSALLTSIGEAHGTFQVLQAASNAAIRAELGLLQAELSGRMVAIARASAPGATTAGAQLWKRASAAWDAPPWLDLSPSSGLPGAGRNVRLGTIEIGVDEEGARTTLRAPLFVPLVCRGNLILEASGSELAAAHEAQLSAGFRLLSTLPPGKVRLTCIDPIGLGGTYSDLLKLSEDIRGPKFYHEDREIADALDRLTAHMSMVIQKYLHSDFSTIEEYNAQAGEIEEPYRLLLVSRFPAGFRPETAQRLYSLAENGPARGVHVLMTVDSARPKLHGVDLAGMYRYATTLVQGGGSWSVHGLSGSRVVLDRKPPTATMQAIVESANNAAASAGPVQVAFDKWIAPKSTWSFSSAEGLFVPLGRRGARDIQELKFGFEHRKHGAHHALIAGATGFGKSGLMHVIICALATHYSPEEVELYLLDLKGSEFQPYTGLPHVRVLASASEREFGVSVLEGLLKEMKRREDLFSTIAAKDFMTWRTKSGSKLPRIVLVLDEFQVLFGAQDAVANVARQHLSTLVRLGRSWGIHLILGSQTVSSDGLDGATLSNIVTRIALKLTAPNSERVLATGNIEASRLQRPGEAIFNGNLGESASNEKFQVAYVPEALPAQVAEAARARARAAALNAAPAFVFEGNKPAVASGNRLLASGGAPVGPLPRFIDIQLGAPTTVQDGHVAWRMSRQSRGNLLLLGAEEVAFNVVAAAAASLIRQTPGGAPRVRILNLTNVDDPLFTEFDEHFARVGPAWQIAADKDGCSRLIAEAHAELLRRVEAANAAAGSRVPMQPTEVLIVFGLHRGRAFEKINGRVSPATTQLVQLLVEGPEKGLHTLIWTDNYANLCRVLSGGDITEFGGKLVFDAGEAAKVFGNPSLTSTSIRLGYGLLGTSVEPDRLVKVRCYGRDSVQWLATHCVSTPTPA